MRAGVLIGALLFVAACRPTPEPAPAQPTPQISERTQYELVDELRSALRTPVEDRDQALTSLRAAWSGQVYTWEMHVIPALCTSPTRCNVAPFDHMRFEGVVVQGWLPAVELNETEHAELLSRCTKSPCVATFRGTLDLEVSAEEPTSVRLLDATVLDTRRMKSGESWVRRRS